MGAQKPTASELAILNVLWNQGPSTVRAVHDILSQSQEIGYTTVLKLLQIMHQKNLVTRDSSSRAHVYAAAEPAAETQQSLVKDLLDSAFSGSAQKLVLSALSAQPSSPEELAEIRRLIDKLETDTPNSSNP